MHEIGPIKDFAKEGIYEVKLEGNDYLVICHDKRLYCIEDKCGHFGVPLSNGRVEDGKIFCAVHGISFNLKDGQIAKSWGEDCVPVKVVKLVAKDGMLYYKNLE